MRRFSIMLLYLLCACGVEASWRENPLINFDKILFVRRNTYSSNHYYTEHINSRWMPGGNICTFDVKTG